MLYGCSYQHYIIILYYGIRVQCTYIYIYTHTIADTDSNVIRDRYFCHTYLYSL